MQLRLEFQRNPVADEVGALTAVVRPILTGLLFALKQDVVDRIGGRENVSLAIFARMHRPGDGDCGICFEYAVHEALARGEPIVSDRIDEAVRICHVPGGALRSILFGVEKSGSRQLIDTAAHTLTEDSVLLSGLRGRPVKLRRHLRTIADAFRRPDARADLPVSIGGLWKADLFVGFSDSDRWVGTSVKINRDRLEPARGLRLGIVPSRGGRNDGISRDERRNLVVCPLPHDAAFMEIFYRGWGIVQQLIAADARMPREVFLPVAADRQVAQYLVDRRDFPVLEVIEALGPLAQPELLETSERNPQIDATPTLPVQTEAVLAPMPRQN